MEEEVIIAGQFPGKIAVVGGTWRGMCLIPTPKGPVRVSVKADASEEAMEYALMLALKQQGVEVGRIGGRFRKLARKLARARILSKLAHAAKKVVHNPIMAKAVGLASMVPGYGDAIKRGYAAARKATSITDKLARGDMGARGAVMRIRKLSSKKNRNKKQRQSAGKVIDHLRSTYARRYGFGPAGARISGDLESLRGYREQAIGPVTIIGAEANSRYLWDDLREMLYRRGVQPVDPRREAYTKGQGVLATAPN